MGFSRLCIRALVCCAGTRLEPRAIVACKNASKIIGRSKTRRKSNKRKNLLHKSLKKPIQNDPTLSQWLLGASVALVASWVPPGSFLGAFWEPPGSPGCLLGASWEPPGCLLGAFWEPPGDLER